ncbi:MAG: GNAT family N-acetyltransferase [Acidobacteriaceae bacterium]
MDATWIQRALLLSKEAGWNQNAADWAVFFAHGTVLGFTVGERLVATAAALPYGEELGWISMVLVTPEWRRRGLAHQLVAACTAVLRNCGRAAFLDAAPAAISIYAALGFVPLCGMERWEGDGGAVAATGTSADLALDRFAFGADRHFLFEDFLSRPDSLAMHSANGFAILRRGSAASHLGPIVAEPGDASLLLVERGIRAASGRVLVDVLDAGRGIIPQLAALGFQQRRCFTRMALGLTSLPGNPAWLLAAAGPEFG